MRGTHELMVREISTEYWTFRTNIQQLVGSYQVRTRARAGTGLVVVNRIVLVLSAWSRDDLQRGGNRSVNTSGHDPPSPVDCRHPANTLTGVFIGINFGVTWGMCNQ